MRPEDPEHDELEGLLRGGLGIPPPPEGLREAVLERTAAVLRRRVLARRLGKAAGALAAGAAVYAAGFLTRLGWEGPEVPGGTQREQSEMMTAPREPEREDPAEIRRRVPRASPGERIRLLELAGDSYLAGGADLEAALDCYRQALELARSPADVKPEPTDTWLLASLKLSRRLEEGR